MLVAPKNRGPKKVRSRGRHFMRSDKTLVLFTVLAATAAFPTAAVPAFAADKEQILYNFCSVLRGGLCSDGALPYASLTFDASGNLYGTTSLGGDGCDPPGCGVVFKLEPAGGGEEKETVLHSFGAGFDGYSPLASVTLDRAGNVYGTASMGGASGNGIVYELVPGKNGKWAEKVLRSFKGKDGRQPTAALVFDAAGQLYGTTFEGGTGQCKDGEFVEGCGIVFRLTLGASGAWTEKVLYYFKDKSPDAINPNAGVVFDSAGNLYGTTSGGGTYGVGTVYELSPEANGTWAEKVLHSFGSEGDGVYPAGLVFDAAGNLYGTTYSGGLYGGGTVFQLVHGKNRSWTEKTLYSFCSMSNCEDGLFPESGVILDKAGSLYGTTYLGGAFFIDCQNGLPFCGTVFELTPRNNGPWTEKVLHSFQNNGKDGVSPDTGLAIDATGNLYGTTGFGGAFGSCDGPDGPRCGVVFEITP